MSWTRVASVIAAALLIAAVILLAFGFWAPATSGANRVERGAATTYGPGYDGWLALPEGPGHRVEICSKESGTKRCEVRTSNDAGPALSRQRAGVIVDLDIPTFEALCKCGWRTGVIEVTVEYLSSRSVETNADRNAASPAARPTLPPTDTGD